MAMGGNVGWYARRLAAMSAAEVAHRVIEQAKRRIDRVHRWGWEAFGGFGGAVAGLPGLEPNLSAEALKHAHQTAAQVKAVRLRFLGQDWPGQTREDWWNGQVWFLDPVSGLTWPGAEVFAFDAAYRHEHARGDIKFVWEINRLQFLPALAASGDAGADIAFAILAGWMAANPPYCGVNWIGGIEAASRLVSVLAMLTFVKRELTAAEARMVRAFVEAHTRWIDRYPSRYSSANNHAVAERAGLFLAGLAAPGMAQAARYRREGRAGLEREILIQFYPDGVGAEQSPTYAAYSLEWFVLAGRAADAAGEPMSQAYRARAAAAAEHLRWMIDDGGCAPRVGDDDEGRVLSFDLAQARDYPLKVVQKTEDWLGLSDTVAARVGVRTFADRGYTIARQPTSRGTALFVLDHAPLGFLSIAAHGHADALAIWLHWGEEPILVDAGTYLYHAGSAARDAFRGTPAHNTLALDTQDQSRIAGPFNWSDHVQTRLIAASGEGVVAEQSGYRRRFGLVHRRSVRFEQGRYVIEDELIGAPTREAAPWTIGYLLHPDVSVTVNGTVARLATPAGRELRLTIEMGPDWIVEDGDYSPAFNTRITTRRLIVRGLFRHGDDGCVSRVAIVLDQEPAI